MEVEVPKCVHQFALRFSKGLGKKQEMPNCLWWVASKIRCMCVHKTATGTHGSPSLFPRKVDYSE